MKGTLTFLGTGGSVGVPMIGCSCEVCHSPDPLNQRLRPSALLRVGSRQFLIDVGPDFRMQALRASISTIDGLLLTHAHHDHTAGLDDLRPIYYHRQTPFPILLSKETAQEVLLRFSYLFHGEGPNFVSRFELKILPDQEGEILFENLPIQYMTYMQGKMSVNGYRIGDLAYVSDIKNFSPSIFERLKGVKQLVISALRYTASPMHLSVDEAIDFAKRLKVERAWLTHISHDLEHHKTNSYLPEFMSLAYDGLEIDFG